MTFSEGNRPMSESRERRAPLPAFSGDLEEHVDQHLKEIGRGLVKQWLERLEQDDPEPKTSCKWCGMEANFFSKRARVLNTPFGAIRYMRAYYICPVCHRSTCPLDEWLNPMASLQGMRNRLASGAYLPVDKLAEAWKLGKSRSIEIGAPIHHWSNTHGSSISPIKSDHQFASPCNEENHKDLGTTRSRKDE